MRWLQSTCASLFPCQHAEHAHKEGSSITPVCSWSIWPRGFPNGLHWNHCGPDVITSSLSSSLSVAPCAPVFCSLLLPPALCSVCYLFLVCLLTLSCYSFTVVVFTVCIWMISWGYQTFLKEKLSINIFLILTFIHLGDPAWIFAIVKGNY